MGSCHCRVCSVWYTLIQNARWSTNRYLYSLYIYIYIPLGKSIHLSPFLFNEEGKRLIWWWDLDGCGMFVSLWPLWRIPPSQLDPNRVFLSSFLAHRVEGVTPEWIANPGDQICPKLFQTSINISLYPIVPVVKYNLVDEIQLCFRSIAPWAFKRAWGGHLMESHFSVLFSDHPPFPSRVCCCCTWGNKINYKWRRIVELMSNNL